MEFFKENQVIILRSLGAFMLVVGFIVHFWASPKEALSPNEIAAANVARMEAHTNASSTSSSQKTNTKHSKFLEKLKGQQAKQLEYLTILAMLLGFGFLGYSFVKKKEDT